jgi:4-hydroxybenzoate polyprenyltransferase
MDDDDRTLGKRFWLWTAGVVIGVGAACIVIALVVTAAWAAWGAIGALIFFGVVLLLIGWVYDRRQVKKYNEL